MAANSALRHENEAEVKRRFLRDPKEERLLKSLLSPLPVLLACNCPGSDQPHGRGWCDPSKLFYCLFCLGACVCFQLLLEPQVHSLAEQWQEVCARALGAWPACPAYAFSAAGQKSAATRKSQGKETVAAELQDGCILYPKALCIPNTIGAALSS